MVEELQQESLVQEVSELVHRRLVTSALEGNFRNVLELHVQVSLCSYNIFCFVQVHMFCQISV